MLLSLAFGMRQQAMNYYVYPSRIKPVIQSVFLAMGR